MWTFFSTVQTSKVFFIFFVAKFKGSLWKHSGHVVVRISNSIQAASNAGSCYTRKPRNHYHGYVRFSLRTDHHWVFTRWWWLVYVRRMLLPPPLTHSTLPMSTYLFAFCTNSVHILGSRQYRSVHRRGNNFVGWRSAVTSFLTSCYKKKYVLNFLILFFSI